MGARPVNALDAKTRQAHAELLRALLYGAQDPTLPLLLRAALVKLCDVFNQRGAVREREGSLT